MAPAATIQKQIAKVKANCPIHNAHLRRVASRAAIRNANSLADARATTAKLQAHRLAEIDRHRREIANAEQQIMRLASEAQSTANLVLPSNRNSAADSQAHSPSGVIDVHLDEDCLPGEDKRDSSTLPAYEEVARADRARRRAATRAAPNTASGASTPAWSMPVRPAMTPTKATGFSHRTSTASTSAYAGAARKNAASPGRPHPVRTSITHTHRPDWLHSPVSPMTSTEQLHPISSTPRTPITPISPNIPAPVTTVTPATSYRRGRATSNNSAGPPSPRRRGLPTDSTVSAMSEAERTMWGKLGSWGHNNVASGGIGKEMRDERGRIVDVTYGGMPVVIERRGPPVEQPVPTGNSGGVGYWI